MWLGHLEQKALLRSWDPAVSRSCFHQNDIRANFFDTVPGNYVVLPSARDSEKTTGARYHDGTDMAFRDINLHIGDESQPLAGADADDLLALQVCKFDGHEAFPLLDSLYVVGIVIRIIHYRFAESLRSGV